MNFLNTNNIDENLREKPKGLRVILQERGLWRHELHLQCGTAQSACNLQKPDGCCARGLMSIQPDFVAQKNMLEEAVVARGYMAILFPVFHCELNWIEHFWGAAKYWVRKHYLYHIQGLREEIPRGLQYGQNFIWKYWNKTHKIMQLYREGEGYGAEKKYKSHRRVNSIQIECIY